MVGAHLSLVYSFKSCPSTRWGWGHTEGVGQWSRRVLNTCLSCIYHNFYIIGECSLLFSINVLNY